MEEKERYEWDKIEESYEWIRDTETDNQPLYYDLKTVAHLLNQQDKYIKELESHTEELENIKAIQIVDAIKGYENQIRNLKQAQKQLAVEELEKLKDFFLEPYRDEEMDTDFLITKDAGSIADYVLDRIKELGGEENE